MKKHFSKLLAALFICMLGAIMIATSAITAFAADTNEPAAVAEEEITATLTDSGVCGTSATWEYYAEIGTLKISGSGAITSSPWSSYRSKITNVVVSDEITSISKGTFNGLSSLKEISLPFVGESRTATGPNATFGYVFGYTTLDVNTDDTYEYHGIFNGNNTTSVGYVHYTYISNSGYSMKYVSAYASYSDLGWGNSYGYVTTTSTAFLDYRVGYNTYYATGYSNSYDKFTQPSGTTWQYSCNNAQWGTYSNRYTLQSYYYYIPSSLTTVNITDASKIETAAFMNCSNITEINLNSEITKISDYAFRECTNLNTLTLPSGLTSIGAHAMYNCDALTNIEFPGGLKTISAYAFYDCDKLSNVKFHDDITAIGTNAFYSCGSLKNVELPKNLDSISAYAFSNCTSFTAIVIPDKVVTIESSAFSGCSSVKTIYIGENVKTIGSYVFSGLNLVQKVTVPNSVTSIGIAAFRNCSSIKEISLPFVGESRTATGPNATFGYIFGYTTVSADTDDTYEYHGIFNGNNATMVGYTRYYYVNSSVGSSLVYTGEGTTYSTLGWSSQYAYTTTQSTAFLDYRVGYNTYYSTGSSNSYNKFAQPSGTTWQYSCNNAQWGTYSNRYTLQSYYYYIPSSITKVNITDASKIETAAFMNCSNITEINLNSEITKISDYAFRECTKLDTFSLPSDLKNLGSYVMYNCDALESIEIPNGTTTISDYSFYDCDKLTTVEFHNDVTSIGASAFYSCGALKNVDLPENLDTIYGSAFQNCTSFTEIIIPDKVTTIKGSAFSGCSSVKTIMIGEKVTSIESYAFSGCTNTTSLTIGKSVKTISSYAFNNLSKIQKITVPNNVISIGQGAFKGCSSLLEIDLPFVGESRTATGPNATFGYIFGYITVSADTDDTYEYHGIFNGNNTTMVGYTRYYYVNSSVGSSLVYTGEGTTYSTLGWSSQYAYTTTQSTAFLDYRVGYNTYYSTGSSNSYNKFAQPSGTTWQYSCNNAQWGTYSNRYTLQSYYYYIPSSLTTVNITDASKIETAAFMNCTNITEINLNTEIASVEDYAFRNFGVISNSTDSLVISGDILLSYKGTDKNIVIPENIKIIAPRAFYGKSSLTSVTFADKTGFVGAYAFNGCTNMTVYVPRISGGLTLGTGAFNGTGSVNYLDKSSYTNGKDTFYYNIDANGNAVIVDCSTTSANITLPVTLGGYTVTTVGYKGMANCTTLKSVTIPSNIIKLDLYAFYGCTGLDTATIPATCVYVGEYAFAGCTSMTSVVIAEGVTHLGDNCFENCTSLTEIVVPDSCVYLGKYALYNCKSLESATIGINVPSIGKYTFYNCEKLKTVVIGIKVESIGEYAFYNAALERVSTPATLKSIGDYAFAENTALTRVSLKSGIQSIGNGAFYGDSVLATINLPATIETIGSYAFYDCAALTSVTVPALVTVINDYTYANCSALTTVKLNADTVVIGDKAFAYCSSLNSFTAQGDITSIGEKAFYKNALETFDFKNTLVSIGADAFAFNPLTSISLPDTLTHLGEQAFANCSTLSAVSMPDSVTYVGAYAFEGNTEDLTITIRYNSGKIANYMLYNTDVYKVIMEDGITEIGNYVFALCHNLTEIEFPSTLKKIGNYAFYDNRMYSELTLPSAVETIGNYAFARGYNLVKISIPDSVQSIGTHAFMRAEAINHIDPEITVYIYYNKGVLCDNLLDSQDMHHIIVADYVHTVGNNVFSNAPNLKDISLPDTISSFGSNCFVNDNSIVMDVRDVDGLVDDNIYQGKLTGVRTVNITDTAIGKYAFADNVGLKYANITGDTDIGDYAFNQDIGLLTTKVAGTSNVGNYSFYNCNAMTTFTIDGTIERIGEHAFDSCKALKAMALPTTVNYIGSYAFYDCNSTASINIPEGVEKILSHTFYGCASLGSIEVPNSVIAIEDYAFYGCVVAKSITLSNQCKTIGEAAFYNCKALTELLIPDSVTSIGAYAFRSCGGITELVFSDNVDEIGACAFYDCNGLKTVKLGKKIIELGDRLFYGCVNLESLYVYAPLSYIDTLAFYGADFVTVYCGRDDYMISFFDENGIFYEILDDLVYEYKITFVTDNGEIISSATYTSGSTVTPPTNPTKSADNTYTYVFAGWDQDITIVGGNKTYTASFTPVYIEYTVVFKDYNGNTISSGTYHYGDTVTAPSDPTRAADNTYTYAFAGWNNAVVECAGDATYTATYTPTYIEYTVVFKDYDGEIISSKTYHYGDAVTAPSNPVREADLVGTYSFKNWDNAVVACAGDATYTAVYDIAYIDYTVTFKDYNGNTISSKTYHYGDTVTVPSDPTRAADNTYTYAFAGWDTSVVSCAGNATYTATYTPTYIEYTVVFKDYDGETISTKDYHYGDAIDIPSDPTRAADTTYTYAFAGWDTNVASTCGGSATYTATYTPTYIEYTVVFKDYDGEIISTNTYHYGDTVTAPTAPTRETDVVGSYTFKAWDSEVVACDGDKVYTATYDVDYTDYTVVFKNYNGDVLSTNTYHYGDTVVVPSDPSKPADETYTYAFIGWDNTVTKCEGNATYTAKFAPTNVEYTVVFKDESGKVISTKTYYYGAKVEAPNAPSKAADNTYTYTFAGWDKEVVDCVADATYTATYTPVYIDYTVTFIDYDGSTIKTVTYHYGDTIEAIADPTRASDETYTYAFAGWDKALGICKGDTTFKATYTPTYIDYTVIFKNENGTVLSRNTYHYGDVITVPATPTKAADNTYTYTFNGWDKAVVNCAGDATYTATYKANHIDYTVIFKNADGTVLSTKTYHYGDAVTAPTTPTKAADNTYTYSFKSWDKEVVDCVADATYTATYNANYIDYTVIFKNADGTILSTKTYHYGDIVTVPTTPTKVADNTYTYTFKSWDKEVVNCSGNVTYTATYNSIYIDYTVTFKNEDGSIISEEKYHYGDTVEIPGTPTKQANNTYTYTFAGWDSEVVACDGDKVYTATFMPVFIEYTVVFKDWNGNEISSNEYHYGQAVTKPSNPTRAADNTYTYTFAGWDKTVTACTESTVYTATYSSTYIEYTIVFKNYDGSVLSTNTYYYGASIVVPDAPTKPADENCTYGFAGWDSEVTACLGSKTYTATFNPTNIDYTVVFKDWDGEVISSATYHFGDEIVVPNAPSRNADNKFTYAFKDWGKTVSETCVGNAEYTANYEATYIEYNIRFLDWDGSLIQTVKYHYGDTIVAIADPERESDETYTYTFLSWNKALGTCTGNASFTAQYESTFINYTVIFKDYDGSVISRKTYHFGQAIDIPVNPVRVADNTYTYTFKDWGNISTTCNGNKEYTANYTATYIDYTVIFKDYDGKVISSQTYNYGADVTAPSDPTRAADNTYTYAFAGWDQEVVDCAGDATYTATYTPTHIDYTVVFKDHDGTIISTKTYHYGDAVTVPTAPTRESDVYGSYTFKAWDSTVVNCAGDATYTATYDITYTDYTVIFKDEDGTVLDTKTYHYGDEVTAPTTPTKVADNTYTYTFKAWDSEVVACAGNATYTATYESTYIDYTVIFKNEDGTVLDTKTYHYGDEVTAPTTPTKAADNTYTYTFKAWDSEVVACAGNATYTATYESTYIDYTVVFKDENGTVLSTNIYHYGDEVVAPTAPTKAADNTYTYSFKAWDSEVVACAGDATYTATYESTYIDYTVIFKNEDGTVLSTNTYHYGDEVTAPTAPIKEADDEYTYTFAGWDKEIVACAGDATYTATYSATAIEDTQTPGTDTEPGTDSNTPSDNDTNDENDGLSGGAVAGIAAGSTVAAGAGGFSLFWFVIKKKRFSDLLKVFKKK